MTGQSSSGDESPDRQDSLTLQHNATQRNVKKEWGGSNDDICTPHYLCSQLIPVLELFESGNTM